MLDARDQHLEQMACRASEDRANGSYDRHWLTEMGDVLLQVPRTRLWSAAGVIQAYCRRSKAVDRAILSCFLLGLSTRKVAGLSVNARRVCQRQHSEQHQQNPRRRVAAFHRRPIRQRYRVLIFDGVVLSRKTGAGAVRRPVLVSWNTARQAKGNYRLPSGPRGEYPSLGSIPQRPVPPGLDGEGLEMICSDGGSGLRAALPLVYPHVPVQLCWAHKTRNVLDKVRRADQPRSSATCMPSVTPSASPRP